MNRFIVILMIGLVLMVLAGCEEQNRSKVWGNGDLPADYVQTFGIDNTARLNFVQNQVINNHEKAITELLERVQSLEAENPAELACRVRNIEKVVRPDRTAKEPEVPSE